MRAVLLAHDQFGLFTSKTAASVLRYRRTYEPVAVLDRSKAERDAGDVVGDIGRGVPILAHLRDALPLRPQALVIGIAPRGGILPPGWREEIRLALETGIEVHSGLHTFLADDPELAAMAQKKQTRIWDVRRPSRPDRIATGEGRLVRALVVHTVGTDCNSGKMTTTVELVEEAKRRGLRAGFAATGQTGVLIGCDAGSPIDRVVSDFVAGAAEELVLECAKKEFDLVAVEGQGALTHPAYSGVTLSLLHGSFPDQVILCHAYGRTHHSGYERPPNEFRTLGVAATIRLIESLLAPVSGGHVVAVSLATPHLGEADARAAVHHIENETGLPTTDPIRFGPSKLLDAVIANAAQSHKEGARRLLASASMTSR